MYRATTPTHTFTLPDNTSLYDEIQVTYKQKDLMLVKHYQDGTLPDGMVLDGKDVIITLTQTETLAFVKNCPVHAQVRVLTTNGQALASQQFTIKITDVLNEEVLG